MRNLINVNGTEIKVIGFDEYELLGYQVLEALNNDFILEELVDTTTNTIEVTNHRNGYYTIGGNEYRVFEGEKSAKAEAIVCTLEVFEDCGLSDELLTIADNQGMIDNSWFENVWSEIHESQAYEESIEYIATNAQLEQLEDGTITEDDIRDDIFEGLQSSIAGQEVDEYKFQFGNEEYQSILVSEGLIDLEELAEYCVDEDGLGILLATYDGEEINMGDLYIYRTN